MYVTVELGKTSSVLLQWSFRQELKGAYSDDDEMIFLSMKYSHYI